MKKSNFEICAALRRHKIDPVQMALVEKILNQAPAELKKASDSISLLLTALVESGVTPDQFERFAKFIAPHAAEFVPIISGQLGVDFICGWFNSLYAKKHGLLD